MLMDIQGYQGLIKNTTEFPNGDQEKTMWKF